VQRETVATSEESIELRSAAINLLDHGVTLTGLACDCPVTSLQQQARQRIAKLIDSDRLGLPQLTDDGLDIMVQFAIVGFCQDPALLSQLMETRRDPQFLYQIATQGVSARLRELAADKISDETTLMFFVQLRKKPHRLRQILKPYVSSYRPIVTVALICFLPTKLIAYSNVGNSLHPRVSPPSVIELNRPYSLASGPLQPTQQNKLR